MIFALVSPIFHFPRSCNGYGWYRFAALTDRHRHRMHLLIDFFKQEWSLESTNTSGGDYYRNLLKPQFDLPIGICRWARCNALFSRLALLQRSSIVTPSSSYRIYRNPGDYRLFSLHPQPTTHPPLKITY